MPVYDITKGMISRAYELSPYTVLQSLASKGSGEKIYADTFVFMKLIT